MFSTPACMYTSQCMREREREREIEQKRHWIGMISRACLVAYFKQLFEHFKHTYTHFHTLFHPHVYQKHPNNITQTLLPNTPQISHELSLSITIQYFFSHFGVNVVQKDDIKYHNQNLMTLPKEIK